MILTAWERDVFYEAVEEAKDNGDKAGLHRAYSGRGMYGVECVGISGEDPTWVVVQIRDMLQADEDGHEELVKLLKRSNVDSMGRSKLLYWPDLFWGDET